MKLILVIFCLCIFPVAVEVPDKTIVTVIWFRLHVKTVAVWLRTQAHLRM